MSKLTKFRLWLLDHLPAGVIARPAEWFLAIVCLLSGPSILTGVSEPRSVAALLPREIYTMWGGVLLIGGLGLVCGLSSYRRTPGGHWTVTRVPCYRLGLRLLGLSALLYAGAQVIFGGWGGVFASSLTFIFAAMCGVRLLTVGQPR
jgi:hypothetical protein